MVPELPSKATLSRYGLTATAWHALVDRDWWLRRGYCPICHMPKDKWVIDHEHVARWKLMEAEERVRYVRGVLCARCNWRYLVRGLTSKTAQAMAAYLRRYEAGTRA